MLFLEVQESLPLIGLSCAWYSSTFIKAKSGIYFNFHSFALPELETFSFFVCLFMSMACLYFESDIFPAWFISSYIVRLLTFLLLSAFSVDKYLPYTVFFKFYF